MSPSETKLARSRLEILVVGGDTACRGALQSSLTRALTAQGASDRFVFVVWGMEWLDSVNSRALWAELQKALDARCRILVFIPEETPDEMDRYGQELSPKTLLKAIVFDSAPRTTSPSDPLLLWVWMGSSRWFTRWRDIPKWAKANDADSRLFRLCNVCAHLPKNLDVATDPQAPNGTEGSLAQSQLMNHFLRPQDFFRFIDNPTGYQTKELHGARASSATNDGALCPEERLWARKVSLLKYLAGRYCLAPRVELNVLVVDNNLQGLTEWAERCSRNHVRVGERLGLPGVFGYLTEANWYVVTKEFFRLRTAAGRNGPDFKAKHARGRLPTERSDLETEIPWDKIDLVLQDIMLGGDTTRFTGLDLVPHYLEACPQALIFLITGMDVESLISSSEVNWKHVDAVIPKRRLEVLWWEYHRCFRRRFGRMFWDDWVAADEGEVGIANRDGMRALFGSLRKWQIEPAILGHGQGVPEMIDHAERHIGCLWRNVDDFVAELLEHGMIHLEHLALEDRMLLAMATWLHDLGHRGDTYTQDSATVRSFHAGISEHLLLKNPEAYGLGWLAERCSDECKGKVANGESSPRLKCRNRLANGWLDVCPLRKVGLLCRHHQSNAPLSKASLEAISRKGKEPSPYTRVRVSDSKDKGANRLRDDLAEWMASHEPLWGWVGSQIVSLADFTGKDEHPFLALAGVLRMLDGTQLHRHRVGSPTCIESFNEYLAARESWARGEIERVDKVIRNSAPGTQPYLEAIGERLRLEQYNRLVRVQYVHYWRQLAVHDMEIHLLWCEDGRAVIELGYVLDDWGLAYLGEIGCSVPVFRQNNYKSEPFKLKDVLREGHMSLIARNSDHAKVHEELGKSMETSRLIKEAQYWAVHCREELIDSEHKSQVFTGAGGSECHQYVRPFQGSALFRISVLGLASQRFGQPVPIFEAKQ